MTTKHKNTIYLLVIGTLLFGGATQVASWSLPLGAAPGANSNPPILSSDLTQKKKGDFAVSALATFANSIFTGKVRIANNTQGDGKILISGDNAGEAIWVYPPQYAAPGEGVCPPGTSVMSSTGECGYQYTTPSRGGLTYCNGDDIRVSWYDSGIGRNHAATPVEPNGCYAWEGKHNNGGPGCVMQCIGAVAMCYTQANGGEWYLSGSDRKCNR